MSLKLPNKDYFSSLTRREFLKLFSLGLAGFAFPINLLNRLDATQSTRMLERPFGRVFQDKTFLFQKASIQSDIVEEMSKDSIYEVTGYVVDYEDFTPNRVWYHLDGKGYTHSKHLQPVWVKFNQPVQIIPETGVLGEITIPFTDAYSSLDNRRKFLYRLYYASTFWVTGRMVNTNGSVWYQLLDDRNNSKFYAPAYAIRIVPEVELTPLATQIPFDQKNLIVDLKKQTLTAYEGDQKVNHLRISTGIRTSEGGFATPKGVYRTNTKRPCRHMFEPPSEFGLGYDLPGVPWVCYFTRDGIAFHGAYWQNNFGVPYSHGCINMSPQSAKWVYRWTTPEVPFNEYFYGSVEGTRVVIE